MGEAVTGAAVSGARSFFAAAAPEADHALMRGIVAGDERAMASLYDAHVQRVFHAALRIVRNEETAEEVVVDTFWQAWKQAHLYDPLKGTPAGWLLTIARSRALDGLRRSKKHFAMRALDEAQSLIDASAAPPDPRDGESERRQLACAFELLDAPTRQLLTLAYFHGLSHSEIAERQHVPLGTVKTVLRKAVVQLRGRLCSQRTVGVTPMMSGP